MVKKKLLFLSMFVFLLIGSCRQYIGTIEVQKDMNRIGIANPVINLRVTEHSKPTSTIILNKKKFLRSVPKELLTDSEKDFFNNLIVNSISICENNLSTKFIEVEGSELESDFNNIISELNIKETHSNGLVIRDQVFDQLPGKEDNLLTYIIISDRKSDSLKPEINDNTGEHKLIVKKAKYDNFNMIEGTSEENLVEFNDYNLLFTRNNQSSVDINNKDEIIKTCLEYNLDALMTINMKYKFEKSPDLLSLDYKWRIRLLGEIKIFDNKGEVINENSLTGKSEYLKITKSEYNKIPITIQFLYDLDNENSKLELFEVIPRTEYSFSLQNIFGPLYIEATEDFLSKLESLD